MESASEKLPPKRQRVALARKLVSNIYAISFAEGSRLVHDANVQWEQQFTRERLWQSAVYHRTVGGTLPDASQLSNVPEIDAVILTDLEKILALLSDPSAQKKRQTSA